MNLPRAIWWNVLGIGSLLLICGYGGMVMYAFYHDCDPLMTQQVNSKDQLFPLFVMQVMGDYPGIPGKLARLLERDSFNIFLFFIQSFLGSF